MSFLNQFQNWGRWWRWRISEGINSEKAADPTLARYRPWFTEIRKAKPYQLDERTEQLFAEKSTTGGSAWSRLFDETTASLKFDVAGESLGIEATLHLLSDREELKRETAFHAIDKTLHENARLFTQITNVLAQVGPSGETAASEAYVTVALWTAPDAIGTVTQVTSRGRYLDRWELREGRWGIAARHYVEDFTPAQQLAPDEVSPASKASRRDPDDPSYALFSSLR